MTDAGPRYRWVVLFAGAAANGAFNGAIWGLPALGPALRAHYDLDLAQAGLVVTAMPVGVIPVMLLWGMLADRVGERLVLTMGLAGAAAALSAAAFAPNVAVLAAVLFVAGMLGGGTTGAGGRSIVGWFGAGERGFALTVRQVAAPMSGVIMSLSLPAVAHTWGLRYCFFVMAGVMVAAAVCTSTLVREPPSLPHHDRVLAPSGRLVADRRLWRLSAGGSLMIVAQGAISALLVIFLHDVRGLSPGAAAAGWALVQGATVPVRLVIGRLSDRTGLRLQPMRLMAFGSAVLIIGMAGLARGPGEVLYPVLFLGAISAMSWNPLGLTAAAEIGGFQRAGTAMALYLSVLIITFTVAAVSFGALVEATSWSAGFAVLAVLSVAGGLLLTPLAGEERRRLALAGAPQAPPPSVVAVEAPQDA